MTRPDEKSSRNDGFLFSCRLILLKNLLYAMMLGFGLGLAMGVVALLTSLPVCALGVRAAVHR